MTVSDLSLHWHPRMRGLRPSATLAMNEKSLQLARAGRTIYKLGFGQSPFPIPDSVVAALQASAHQKDYLPVRGLPALRAAVAGFHERRHHLSVCAEDVLIGPGSKELIFLAQLVCDAELILPAPSWVSYAPQANLLGRQAQWIQTRSENGWRLMPEELATACQSHAASRCLLILNYPNNPTGLSYTEAQLAALAEVARKHQLLIISDEIYGEVHHHGRHVSIARFYPEGTLVSSGLSKWCGAGGWRLGTMCFPAGLRWLLDATACAASETFSAVAAPVQYAALTAFQRSDELENYLCQTRRILRALGLTLSQRLSDAGIPTLAPDGGFYLFPDFTSRAARMRGRALTTCAELCERLLDETGVALLPGSDFGRPANELACRLAYVDFDGGACLAAATRIPSAQELDETFLREHCGKVLDAIERIIDWSGQR